MTFNFIASVAGPQPRDIARQVVDYPAFAGALPLCLWINDEEEPVVPQWKQRLLSGTTTSWARLNAFEDTQFHQIAIRAKSDLVTFSIRDGFSTVEEALALVEPLPFELTVFGSIFRQWAKEDYDRFGVGRSMVDHGWGCVFRGKGHDRLVSRRWLDFGPWRVLRRPKDTTFIQFHDLAITDPAEAYEQAKAGHERMGNSPIGGYIQSYIEGLLKGVGDGLYIAESRLREIVVAPGIEVSQGQMLCNAALRLYYRLNPSAQQPVDRIAYVFMDMDDARAHLHELWLRELECWAFNDHGQKVRLDLDYHPTPNPPDWVKRLDG